MRSDHMAVIGEGAAHLLHILQRHFSEVVVLPPSDRLSREVSSHPDMLISVIGGELICHRDYYSSCSGILRRIADFGGLNVCCSDCEWDKEYPHDCSFNALVTTDAVFCRTASSAKEITDAATRSRLNTVNVNQGYAGCSSMFVGGCIITADPSVSAAAKGIYEVIEIAPGGIALDGYDYGFIGGAGGAADCHAYFFGSLCAHPDGDKLRDLMLHRGISVTEIGDGPLTDHGGIKIIKRR